MATDVLAGRYLLEACIAIGGMGEVWRGRDLVLSRPVAIKLMNARYAGDQEAPARFRAEARCAARLCHPGVAKIYDFCEAERPFLVMELVDGPSLAQVLTAGALGTLRAVDVVVQVARALSAAHSAGVIHRDIKPANLVVGRDGQVKLTDFGIAHRAGSAPLTIVGTVVGTAAYLAPERMLGKPATPATDLYSLGIVAFECLAGARPFTGTMTEVAIAQQLRDLPPLPSSVPPALIRLVRDLTAKDPCARPSSAAAVAGQAERVRDRLTKAERHGASAAPSRRAA